MHRNYIGIITPHGLEALYPESDDILRFLQRRLARRTTNPAICYWFDIDEQAATELTRHLRQGYTREALQELQAHVRFGGPMLPAEGHLEAISGEYDEVRLN